MILGNFNKWKVIVDKRTLKGINSFKIDRCR